MSTADASDQAPTAETGTPLLRVIAGNPTDEDIAVLVAVLGSTTPAPDTSPPAARDDWGHPRDQIRRQWGGPGSFTNLRY